MTSDQQVDRARLRALAEKARLKVFARNRLMLAVLFLRGEIRVKDAA